jgi:outer membrane protein TolC
VSRLCQAFGGPRFSDENIAPIFLLCRNVRAGSVVSAYLHIVGSDVAQQQRQQIAQHNIATQEDTVRLTGALANAGQATERNVAQAEALLDSTRSSLPVLDTGRRTAVHRLGVLLGLEPEALATELSASAPLPFTPPEVPVGLPSDLLERRPDKRRADAQLATASARVGQARADYFPKLSLTGSAGGRLQSCTPSRSV